MRLTALLGFAVVLAGCSKADAPPAADTGALAIEAAPPAPAPMSLASLAGTWDVNVMPEGRDTVVTSYVLNTTDSSAWSFAFPNRTDQIAMTITERRGDTLVTHAGPFASALRKNAQVRTETLMWMEDGKLVGRTTARYDTKAADSVVALRVVGTKR